MLLPCLLALLWLHLFGLCFDATFFLPTVAFLRCCSAVANIFAVKWLACFGYICFLSVFCCRICQLFVLLHCMMLLALFAFSCCWWHVVAESVCWVWWWCWPVLIFRPWSPITSGPGEMKSKTVLLDFATKNIEILFSKVLWVRDHGYITFGWEWLLPFIWYFLLFKNISFFLSPNSPNSL